MAMIGKLVSMLAGRSLARTIGGAPAGPLGAAVGLAVPVVIPAVARRLGPVGMVAAAVGSVVFARWLERRAARQGTTAAAPPLPTKMQPAPAGTVHPQVTAPVAARLS